jgi:transcription elongation GreA/GreB family factor
MSRAFVKDAEENGSEDEPLPPDSPYPYYITPDGMVRLTARLAELARDRDAIAASAAEPGAVMRRKRLIREIRLAERKRARAILIDPSTQPRDKVSFGVPVTVEDDGGKVQTVCIVGEDQAAPHQGLISWLSPLAHALAGSAIGDRVLWRRPAGDIGLTVVAIGED